MAKCILCQKDMEQITGCSVENIFCKQKKYPRIKVGDPEDYSIYLKEGERCSDCGALKGKFHHWGCDMERCPICNMQLLGCHCKIKIVK